MWNPLLDALPATMFRYSSDYAEFAAESLRRSWHIGSRYAERALTTAARAALTPGGGEELLSRFLTGCASYMMEMASVPCTALERTAERIERRAGIAESSHEICDVGGKPLMLPVRFAEASQGWAVFAVDAAKAQKALGTLPPYGEIFEVLQFSGQALLVIYAVDFRRTDLGAYREVGVEVWVRPKANPSAFPGTAIIRMSVDGKFSVKGAHAAWNFIKLLAPRMQPTYRDESVTFPVDHDDPNTLAITLPRFGRFRSTGLPIRYYTVKPKERAAWCIVFRRNAEHEGVQFGGDVAVRLGDGKGANCFCALEGGGGREQCLCAALRDMGLPKAPLANGWAGNMTGHVEAPYTVTRGDVSAHPSDHPLGNTSR
ncbi:MAG TPA: hypothetical protein VMA37_06815 [Acetobacteraceae bacterium]|nr:hypothetical protein [Acetobacteraceae bacterium]